MIQRIGEDPLLSSEVPESVSAATVVSDSSAGATVVSLASTAVRFTATVMSLVFPSEATVNTRDDASADNGTEFAPVSAIGAPPSTLTETSPFGKPAAAA